MLDYNKWRLERNLPLLIPRYPKKLRSLSISDQAMEGLKAIAKQYNIVWADEGNVSGLLEMIGLYMLKIEPQDEESQVQGPGLRDLIDSMDDD